MCQCLRTLGAFSCSMALLALNLLDVAFSLLFLVTALLGVWGLPSAKGLVMAYSIYVLVFVVGINACGVMLQPGRSCLTCNLYCVVPALLFELALVAAIALDGRKQFVEQAHVDKHQSAGSTVFWLMGNFAFLAVVASRHAVRFVATYLLRSWRDGIANGTRRANQAEIDSNLSERLLQREVRRERREDLRAHFNNKYFGGKTPDGKPTPPPPSEQPRAELPAFVIANHRDDITNPSRRTSPNAGGIDWDI